MDGIILGRAAQAAGVGMETVRFNPHTVGEARLREVVETTA